MDISTISSLTSASTKLMLASVKARATSSSSNASSSSSSAAGSTTDSTTDGTGSAASATDTAATTAATTATATDSTDADSVATKVAELEAELESGQSLTSDEIKFLNTNSPGTYERILKSLTEKSDYLNSLSGTSTESEAASVHMNKLSDMLTEAKSISNDSSLSDSDKYNQLKNLSSRVSAIEDLTYQYSAGNTSGADNASSFKSLLASVSDAQQQGIIYKYNPDFASSDSTSSDSTSSGAGASAVSSTTSSASSSSSSTSASSADNAATAASATGTSSTGSSSSSDAKSASETLAEIRSIISNQTASSLLSGVKSAGLNLLV